MQNPQENVDYRCKFCDATFFRRHDMLRHFAHKHTFRGPKHRCDRCYVYFPTRRHLKQHIRINHKRKKFTCDECYRKFVSETLFNLHMARHGTHRNHGYFCENCEKVLGTRKHLEVHKCPKDKAPTLLCNLCGKVYSSSKDFYEHRLVCHMDHTYKCDYCSRLGEHVSLFYDKASLAQHIREMHTRSYECEYCFQLFGNKANLAMHLRRPHKRRNCPLCPRQFDNLRIFMEHYEAMHKDQKKEYKCNLCAKPYNTYSGLRSHKLVCSKVMCRLCKELFDSDFDLSTHLHKFHDRITTGQTKLAVSDDDGAEPR